MSRIAIVGSGISGLAAAYYLSRKHEVSLFEKDQRLGGHTHTVTVESSRGPIAVDTGFIVHNDRTYPGFVRLMAELGVATAPSDMSFAVACRQTGFEYSSRGLNGFFAQRSNLIRNDQYHLLREILRFNKQAPALLQHPDAATLSIGDVIDAGRHSGLFTERYLYPMASAVWSMPVEAIRSFPALTMLRFFDNHGMLGINTHPKWRVIQGGSHRYIAPIMAPYKARVQTGAKICGIDRGDSQIKLRFHDRAPAVFDHVVLACHGHQALSLLDRPTEAERDVLSCFQTSRNDVCLHTDSSLLPLRSRARAAWNYNLASGGEGGATVTYHMNRLQSLRVPEDYCVSLNASASIDPSKVLRRFVYHHPIYNHRAIQAQKRWNEISGPNRTHYCGAYWFYGFHEDGLNSATRVSRALGVKC
jgi:predicted NAD/FAD-binding protein